MKIALMARNASLYTHKRLVEAAKQRGHEIQVIDTLRVYLNVASHRPQMRYRGEILEGFDAVIPRIGASITFFGTAVLRQFEMMGVYPLQRVGRDQPVARQVAEPSIVGAQGYWAAGYGIRPLDESGR